MSAETQPAQSMPPTQPGLVTAFAVFAGTLMIIIGVFHTLVGIAALVDDKIYATTPNTA